jgi:hypothetical protein
LSTRVHLVDETWDSVEIQAKLDGSSAGYDETLTKGNELVITSDGPNVLWRRRTDPSNPQSAWQSWHEHACYPGDDKDDYETIT